MEEIPNQNIDMSDNNNNNFGSKSNEIEKNNENNQNNNKLKNLYQNKIRNKNIIIIINNLFKNSTYKLEFSILYLLLLQDLHSFQSLLINQTLFLYILN